ncbi:hypothetical protein LTR78_001278 [Recurvomyces mirabilis]|uniref:Uncharacterized protein n=1 Tax=Recurvomyces mirabilis TaxID=574656 RepID=A0AAE1C5I6_9PEZI|nr:hypothetical protein LTR78_001278 [Recurvomyces mirabilis]KAK5161255.1 hypothetical protein LTS14_001051 [Recurvomyces mirabilis]
MFHPLLLPATLTLLTLVHAQLTSDPLAGVTITASHGGAGSGLTNSTISIPLNHTYTNALLDEVSYLYLTSAQGVDLNSITCQPYRDANGTMAAGPSFKAGQPAFLSTNTVQVGSIICVGDGTTTSSSTPTNTPNTSTSSGAPATTPTLSTTTTTSIPSSASNPQSNPATGPGNAATSTFVTTTMLPNGHSGGSTAALSTITSIVGAPAISGPSTASGSGGSAGTSSPSSTAPASAGLQSASGASEGLAALSEEGAWFGLAIAGLGVAMMV